MSLVCKGRVAALLFCFLICIACGDTYRPTIIPNPVPTPDPRDFHSAMAVNQNTQFYPGTGMQVDAAGDSTLQVIKVAMGPVHAALQPGGSRVWVANSISNSLSMLSMATGTVTSITPATDINLPPGFTPVFVESAEQVTAANASVYVASAASPNPNAANGAVMAVGAGALDNIVTAVIPVGRNPVAIAETPDPNLPSSRELYVVNQGDNTVTHIHGVDQSVVTPAIAVGPSPSLAYARADNQRIYVLNQGSITTIRTFDDSILNGAATPVDAGTNFMLYDSRLNRLYVTSATGFLYVFNTGVDPGSVSPPFLMKKIPIPGSGDCALCLPVSVAALPDGTRAYVASAFETTDSTKCTQPLGRPSVNCYLTQVTVVDALNLTVKAGTSNAPNPIPIPTPESTVPPGVPVFTEAGCASVRFRLSMAVAADSSRVFLAACDAGGVATINTTADTYVVTLPAPVSAFPPVQMNPNLPAQPPPQNPVFLLAGP